MVNIKWEDGRVVGLPPHIKVQIWWKKTWIPKSSLFTNRTTGDQSAAERGVSAKARGRPDKEEKTTSWRHQVGVYNFGKPHKYVTTPIRNGKTKQIIAKMLYRASSHTGGKVLWRPPVLVKGNSRTGWLCRRPKLMTSPTPKIMWTSYRPSWRMSISRSSSRTCVAIATLAHSVKLFSCFHYVWRPDKFL